MRWRTRRDRARIGRDSAVYLGDAMRLLTRDLGLFDALITDPPYSSGGRTSRERQASPVHKYVQAGPAQRRAHNISFSGDNRDQRSWGYWLTMSLARAAPLIKSGGYIMCFSDWRQLPTCSDAFQAAGFVWRGLIVWDKTLSARPPHKGFFRHQCEYIVWGTKGDFILADARGPWPGCISQRVDPAKKLHLTGKPIEVMDMLVQCVAPGGAVLDPFMGSATTGVAALKRGCRFVGIECDPHYYAVALQRLREKTRGA